MAFGRWRKMEHLVLLIKKERGIISEKRELDAGRRARRAHRPTKSDVLTAEVSVRTSPKTVTPLVEGKINERKKSAKSEGGSRPAGDGHRPIIGAHIPCKRCKALPAAVNRQTTSTAPVESTRNPVSASTQAVTAKPLLGRVPNPPHLLGLNCLHPFLRKGANFLQISADCTRLRINYSKAVRTADDGIKIHCPDVETFRSLNKYLVDFKVHFTHEIQADLCQGFPVHSVHRLCRRDGSPLWLVLAVLPRTEEAKNIFNNLNMVCGLSGIRVEAPHKGGPGQCHRCQLYGHAAANCHATRAA
ncbi:hypothetical protein EVAR_86443_1 [Eumeta japonica]|uniref:Pre-C2HC domain-containing protein n=1 Tax=Eumeta variegata TaxID=151549 RepID=A0A4C1ZV06_EUMVA|nr:hypothetical protein EVAR_86443_1 [Eumeta japonica]